MWCVRSDDASFAVQPYLHQSFTDVVWTVWTVWTVWENQYVAQHQWAIY